MTYAIEALTQKKDVCGEAPTWDAANERTIWTDECSDTLYQISMASGEKSVLCKGLTVCGIALNRTGDFVFGGQGLHLWRTQDDCRTLVTEHEGEPWFINDMIADVKGRLYVGTLYWGPGGMEKHGKLYLVSPDGCVRIVEEGLEISNGLGFSPDNRTMYYVDSKPRKIYAYDVDPVTGDLSNKRVFVQVASNEGIPDGLTVDQEGYVWSAQWYGGQIIRYDPDGKVERSIRMPAKLISSLTFGGKDLTDLYVTTGSAAQPTDFAPPGFDFNDPYLGGSFYRIRLDIQGKPEHQADFAWA